MKYEIWSNYNADDPAEAEWDLEDERANLSLLGLPDDLVLIATLQFWNGTVMGYRVVPEATTVADCLQFEHGCDYAEWYVEGNNLCSRQSHHDGTHSIIYRTWKPGLTETQKANFLDKVYEKKATRRDITRYTAGLGKAVREFYGWGDES